MDNKVNSEIEDVKETLLEAYLGDVRRQYRELELYDRAVYLSRLERFVNGMPISRRSSGTELHGEDSEFVHRGALKRLRKKAGLSMPELAELLGFPKERSKGAGMISALEGGHASLYPQKSKYKEQIANYVAWAREQGYDPLPAEKIRKRMK